MIPRKPRVGLLPLYLELYDNKLPNMRDVLAPFLRDTANELIAHGVEVITADICRVAVEFHTAVKQFEHADADCIVTLHLAYSPSLESLESLLKTSLPIIILDTTKDESFGPDTAPDRILYNHGIHGVMDLASMLRRHGRPFQIVAGHVTGSTVLNRAAGLARAAYAARCFRGTKTLRIGKAFAGMGDFNVDESVLKEELGITVKQIKADALAPEVERVTKAEIDREMELDREQFECDLPDEVHERSVRVGLGLRRKLDEGEFTAFSANFEAFDQPDGPVNTPPFLEISKAMSRGIGYAGEGDVLTAALVGALARGFGRTTFTEIFCPDWQGGSLFLSHMGEINPDVSGAVPRLVEKPFPFTPALNPAVIACAPAPGPAVFVNLAPGPDESFRLIVAPVEMLGDTTNTEMRNAVRGWMRPACGVPAFLEAYSRHGGTHHSALVLGDHAEAIEAFAAFLGIDCVRI